jgi:hypothetical protein
MRKRLVDRIPFAKIVIGLAAVFIVSLGSCGLSLVLNSGSARAIGATLSIGGLIGLLVSVVGLVVTCLGWAILSIVGAFGEKVSQPQKLFDEEDDTKLDKRE